MSHGQETRTLRVSVIRPGEVEVALADGRVRAHSTNGSWVAGSTSARLWAEGLEVAVFSGRTHFFTCPDPMETGVDEAPAGDHIFAPMPGLVRQIFVEPGAKVVKGEKLAILEAMKMEHTLAAPRDGVVENVLVVPGALTEAGASLISLVPEEN